LARCCGALLRHWLTVIGFITAGDDVIGKPRHTLEHDAEPTPGRPELEVTVGLIDVPDQRERLLADERPARGLELVEPIEQRVHRGQDADDPSGARLDLGRPRIWVEQRHTARVALTHLAWWASKGTGAAVRYVLASANHESTAAMASTSSIAPLATSMTSP
jgi:hypothetical protein